MGPSEEFSPLGNAANSRADDDEIRTDAVGPAAASGAVDDELLVRVSSELLRIYERANASRRRSISLAEEELTDIGKALRAIPGPILSRARRRHDQT